MSIEVVCACGKRSLVDDRLAGRKGRRGACGAVNVIPSAGAPAGPLDVDLEFDPPLAAPASSPGAQGPAMPPLGTTPFPASDPFDVKKPVADHYPDRIEVRCPCGKTNRYDARHAGLNGACSSCNGVLRIPRWNYMPAVQRVHLIDAEMPFGSMCWFIAKWTLATIPTAIGVVIIFSFLSSLARSR